AEEVAKRTGASVAAINRFSKAAGFDGFADLKAQLGRELQSSMEPIDKLRDPADEDVAPHEKVAAVFAAAQTPEINRAAVKIFKATRTSLLGLGASSYLAKYAEHALLPFLDAVVCVAGDGGTEEVARRLSRCGKGEVLVALSL